MRSHPSCWNKTLAQLGFKRKRRKATKRRDLYKRRTLFENLEQRQMLTADPLLPSTFEQVVIATPVAQPSALTFSAEPEFVLIQPEIPTDTLEGLTDEEIANLEPLFQVETVQTDSGPHAIVSFNPNHPIGPPSSLQELRLELHQHGQIRETYHILVDVADESFREQFLADRAEEVAVEIDALPPQDLQQRLTRTATSDELTEAMNFWNNFIGPKTLEQERQMELLLAGAIETPADELDLTTDELLSVAKGRSNRDAFSRPGISTEQFYGVIEKQADQLKLDQLAATTPAEQQAVAEQEAQLKKLTLLVAKDLAQDLRSADPDIAQSAQKVRDELVALSDPADLLFAGLGVDNEVERKVNNQGDEKAVSFIETGRYVFDDQLEVDLGDHPAMVQVTRLSSLQLPAATSVSGSPAVEDGWIDQANPAANGGTSTTLHVDGTAAAQQESLIRFDLNEVGDFSNPTTIASAAVQLTEATTGSGNAELYVWNGLFGGATGSATDWDETNTTWNHVDGTLGLDGKLDEFTFAGNWTAGTTTEVDVTAQIQRALLYGDANGDGVFGAAGLDGDIEAFHLAVTNWDAYIAEYGPRANSTADLLMRTDGGLGDGTIDSNDIADFFRRHGYSQGDYNLDGTVQDNEDSGIDGRDWAVFDANYGLTNARFTQGDGNFDGVVDNNDYNIWFDRKGEDNLTAEEPELVIWARPEDTATDIEFAAQEHLTLDDPTLVVTEQPDLALNKFTVDDSNLVVDYAVLGDTFTDVKVQLYKTGSPDVLLHETAVQSGTLGSHEVLIATSVLSSIVEGDSVYAKVVGTPASGTQSNTANDELDFEFSTASTQVVTSLDDLGMDQLRRDKHTLRELLAANESLGWFDKITFDESLFGVEQETITLGDHTGDNVADRLHIYQDVIIAGPGASRLAIDARNQTQVMLIETNQDVTLSGLTLTGGYATGHAGGIYNRGQLTLDSVSVVDNQASSHGGGIFLNSTGALELNSSTLDGNQAFIGGGLSATTLAIGASLTIDSSTISNNTSSNSTGGVSVAGTSGASATEVLIVNSTFSGNSAGTSAGGLRTQTNVELTIVNSTFHNNSAVGSGGGLYPHTGTTTLMHNTIVAGNTTGSFPWQADMLTVNALDPASSHNLIGIDHPSTGLTDAVNGNQIGTHTTPLDAMLAPLDTYGDQAASHALMGGSPAIDSGNDAVVESYGTQLSQTGITQWSDMPNVGLVGVYSDIGSAAAYAGYMTEEVVVASTLVAAVTAATATPNIIKVFVIADEFDENLLMDQIALSDTSLREALEIARLTGGTSEIIFEESLFDSPKTILLGDTDGMNGVDGGEVARPLLIDIDTTIQGPGANLLTISGGNQSHVVELRGGGPYNAELINAELRGISITDGNAGGIRVAHPAVSLTLDQVNISDNVGGGIDSLGNLTLSNTTISSNMGAPAVAAGFGQVSIANTTISGNSSPNQAGAVYFRTGNLSISHSTITDNVVETTDLVENRAGGVFVGPHTSDVLVHNSIIVGNLVGPVGSQEKSDVSTALTASFDALSSSNLIGKDDANAFPNGNDNQENVLIADVNLTSLGFNGGSIRTHALLPGSVAIDAGNNEIAQNASLTTDQRGFQRIFDDGVSGPQGRTVDIGAYELTSHIVVDSSSDVVDGNYSAGQLSLREALVLSASASGTETITFSPTVQEIRLSGSELLIEDDVTIIGPGALQLTIDANASSNDQRRVFHINGTHNVDISGLTITGGNVDGKGGGIFNNGGNLDLDQVVVRKNESSDFGGGIYSDDGTVNLQATKVQQNESDSAGGGVFVDGVGSLTVWGNSLISDNAAISGGGGIFVRNSSLDLLDSEVSRNSSSAGGGVRIRANGTETLSITNTLIESNESTGDGGGIHLDRFGVTRDELIKVTIADATLVDNSSLLRGGGLYAAEGEFTVTHSEIERNLAREGGGLYTQLLDDDALTMDYTSVMNNVAEHASSGTFAGGIYVKGPTAPSTSSKVRIERSTIATNVSRATSIDSTNDNTAGGLRIDSVNNIEIINSTISSNVADDAVGGIEIRDGSVAVFSYTTVAFNESLADGAGGLAINSSDVRAFNSIFAENRALGTNDDIQGTFDDTPTDGLVSTNNIVGVGDPFGNPLPTGTNTILAATGQSAGLAALSDNGTGLPATHALLRNSPAIDGGDNDSTPMLFRSDSDQRDYNRVDFPGGVSQYDIGAYEAQFEQLTGDFNGDGFLDSLYQETGLGSTSLDVALGGQGTAGSGQWVDLSDGTWSNFQVGDFNGDGRDDIAMQDGTKEWHIAFSESTRFVLHETNYSTDELGSGPATPDGITLVGDFDADGADELLGRPIYTQNNSNANWSMLDYNDAASFVLSDAGASLRSANVVNWHIFVGDVNRDGRDDLVGTTDLSANTTLDPNKPWYVSLSSEGSTPVTFNGGFDWGDWFDGYYEVDPETNVGSIDTDGPYRRLTEAFASIYNNVELELYYGIKKGPDATIDTKAGSPLDQAAALTELLSNTPELDAVYSPQLVTGTITVDVQTVAEWIGAKPVDDGGTISYPAVPTLLALLDDQSSFTDDGEGSIGDGTDPNDKATFRHAWVEVDLLPEDSMNPVRLDPSWKFKDYQEGIALDDDLFANGTSYDDGFDNGLFDEIKYLDSTVVQDLDSDLGFRILSDSPVEFFEGEAQQWLIDQGNLGKSIADIAYDGPIKDFVHDRLPIGLADGTPANRTPWGSYDDVLADNTKTEALTYRVRLRLGRGTVSTPVWSHQLVVPQSGLTSFVVENVQSTTNSANVTSTLLADGTAVSSADSIAINALGGNELLRFSLEVFNPGEVIPAGFAPDNIIEDDAYFRREIGRDALFAIGIEAGQHSSKSNDLKLEALLTAVTDSSADANDLDELLGLATGTYLRDYRESTNYIAELTSTVSTHEIGMIGVTTPRDVLAIDGEVVDVTFSPFQLVPQDLTFSRLELPLDFYSSETANKHREAAQLAIWQRSALQQDVVSSLLSVEIKSTVRQMQYAYAGQDLYRFEQPSPGSLQFVETTLGSFIIEIEAKVGSDGHWVINTLSNYYSDFSDTGHLTSSNNQNKPGTEFVRDVVEPVADYDFANIGELNAELGIDAYLRIYLYHGQNTPFSFTNIWQELGNYLTSGFSKNDSGTWEYETTRVLVQSAMTPVGGSIATGFIGERVDSQSFNEIHDALDDFEDSFTITTGGGIDGGLGSSRYFFQSEFVLPSGSVGGARLNAVDGRATQRVRDIQFPSIAVPLNLERYYNSRSTKDIGLGVGWTHSFSDRLLIADVEEVEQTNPELIWLTSEGVEHRLKHDGNEYILPSELLGTFTEMASAFIYTSRDGMEVHFDKATFTGTGTNNDWEAGNIFARLDKKVDLNGLGIKVEYTPDGNDDKIDYVAAWSDHKGANGDIIPELQLKFDYLDVNLIPQDQIQRIEKHVDDNDPNAVGVWEYSYTEIDSKQHLQTVTYPDDSNLASPPVAYDYEYYDHVSNVDDAEVFDGLLKKVIEPNADEMEYKYYPNGRLFQSIDGEGATTTYSYDPVQGRTFVTDLNGNEEIISYNKDGLVTRQIHADRTRTETVWGVPASSNTADPENVVPGTEFLRTQQIDQVGATETFEYYANTTATPSTAGNYERELESTKSKRFLDSAGNPVVASNNPEALVTEYKYVVPAGLSAGIVRISSVTDTHPTDSNKNRVTRFEYDGLGRVTASIDAEDHRTEFTYYDTDTQKGLIETKTDPRGTQDGTLLEFRDDANFESVIWQPLYEANFTLPDGKLSVELTRDDTEKNVVADAIRLDLLNDQGAVENTFIIDNTAVAETPSGASDAAFRFENSPTGAADATGFPRYGGDLLALTNSTDKVIWTFSDLPTGDYRVSATWDGNAGARTNARYEIFNSGSLVQTKIIDQRVDPSGFNAFTSTYSYSTSGLVTGINVAGKPTSITEYHHTGRLEKVTDATGRISQSTYDVLGRQKASIAAGNTGAADDLVTSLSYDASGQLEKSIDPLGRTTKFIYDNRGLLTAQEFADGTSTTRSFDAAGNLVASTDELGRTTRFTYDSRNRLVQTIHPDGTSQRLEYDGVGRIATSFDERDIATRFEYDARGQLTKTIQAYDTTDAIDTINKYDIFGDLVETLDAGRENDQANFVRSVSQIKYDKLGRPVQTQILAEADALLADETNLTTATNAPAYLETTRFDPNGNVIGSIIYDAPALAADGANVTTMLDDPESVKSTVGAGEAPGSNVREVQTVFDSYNRPIETILVGAALADIDPITELGTATGAGGDLSTRIHYDASGRVRRSIDELGRVTESVYDTYGRLVETILPDPDGAQSQTSPISEISYDAAGNIVATQDPNGHTTRFQYDNRNRQIAMTDAVGSRYSNVFDKAGQLVATIDAFGVAAATRYDKRGRVILETAADPDGATNPNGEGLLAAPSTQYVYDDAGNLKFLTTSLGNQTEYVYDNLNRLASETTVVSFIADDNSNPGDDPQFAITGEDRNAVPDQVSSFGNDHTDISRTNPTDRPTADWIFTDVEAGIYRLLITWQTNEVTLDTAAEVRVGVDGSMPAVARDNINQNEAPAEVWRDHQGAKLGWMVIAEDLDYTSIQEQVLVKLVGSQGATIRADAVMLERLDATHTYGYNNDGSVKKVTDLAQRETEFVYDELGRTVKTKLPDPDGNDPLSSPVTQNAYDGFGNLVTTTRSKNGILVRQDDYEYDQRNRLILETLDSVNRAAPTSDSNSTAEELKTDYFYDEVGNLLETREGAQDATKQIITKSSYDDLNRLTDQTFMADSDPASTNWNLRQEFLYDASGNLIEQRNQVRDYDDPAGFHTETVYEFVYDDVDRLVAETSDAEGPLASTYRYRYDAVGNLLTTTDPTGRVSTNRYDDLYRLIEASEPDEDLSDGTDSSLKNTFSYDSIGNLAITTNGEGENTSYVYDPLGRSVQMIDGRGKETRYQYDSLGNLRKLTDPNFNETTYEYDALDRMKVESIFEDGSARTRQYDYYDDGTLKQTTDRDGRIIKYQYDGLGRVEQEQWFAAATPGTPETTLSWAYDSLGRVTRADTRAGSGVGTVLAVNTYEYDTFNRITKQRNWDDSGNPNPVARVNLEYDYDREATDPLGLYETLVTQVRGEGEYDYAYTTRTTDNLGRLIGIEEQANPALVDEREIAQKEITFSYDAAGRMTSTMRSTPENNFSFRTSYGYDDAGRLKQLNHNLTNPVAPFANYGYTYDNASRITNVTATTDASDVQLTRTESYTYDNSGQLKNFASDLTDRNVNGSNLSSNSPVTFDYDDAGNREYIPDENQDYGIGENNRVADDGTYTYTYDYEGNTTSRSKTGEYTEYVWDHRNRLIEVIRKPDSLPATDAEWRIEYTYNNDDLRVRRAFFNGTNAMTLDESLHYVYEGGQLVLVLEDNVAVRHRYVNGPGVDTLLVDEAFDVNGENGVANWTANDHAGSVRDVIDSTGALVNHLEYDAFGKVANAWAADKSEVDLEALATDIAFAGRERDAKSELYYNRARWFDADLGRFISEDPIGYAGDASNLYRYAGNDPINYGDPSGFFGSEFATDNSFYHGDIYVPDFSLDFPRFDTGGLASIGNFLSDSFVGLLDGFDSGLGRLFDYSTGLFDRIGDLSTPKFGPQDILNALSLSRQEFLDFTFSIPGDVYEDIVENQLTAEQYSAVVAKLDHARAPIESTADKVIGALGTGVEIVGAFVKGGAVTGGKAVSNAAASALSLGFYDGPFEANKYDLGYETSRAFAGVSGEILVGLGTGGLASTVGKVGKVALAADTLSNVVGVGRGVNDVVQQGGLTVGNSIEIGGSLLGLRGNFATGGQALADLASDASRIRVEPFGVSGGVPLAKVRLAPARGAGTVDLPILDGKFTPAATKIVGSQNAYSSAFRTQLPATAYPGRSRGFHFQQANRQLVEAIDADPRFAQQIDSLIPGIRGQLVNPRSFSRQPPAGWTWHHHADTGVLELVPRVQHEAAGPIQQLLHPGGRGGMNIWGQ